MKQRDQGTEDFPRAFVEGRFVRFEPPFFDLPPAPRYGIPPYLIAKGLRDRYIPFPYLVHTVCIPPYLACSFFAEKTARRTDWLGSTMERLCAERGNNRQTWWMFFASDFRGLRRECAGRGLTGFSLAEDRINSQWSVQNLELWACASRVHSGFAG